jgi:hypothetical protein
MKMIAQYAVRGRRISITVTPFEVKVLVHTVTSVIDAKNHKGIDNQPHR